MVEPKREVEEAGVTAGAPNPEDPNPVPKLEVPNPPVPEEPNPLVAGLEVVAEPNPPNPAEAGAVDVAVVVPKGLLAAALKLPKLLPNPEAVDG